MASTPVSYAVPGGTLHALRFGEGPRVVLAAHGITSTSMAWPAVAARLPDDWSMVAVDLRGRGHSRDLPGPYGLRTHASDLHAVAEAIGEPVVLAGHSMGAFVAVHAAHDRPDLFSRVVLVDGGVALPVPEGADPDQVLDQTLGPAIERLGRTYASVDDYVEVFRTHPAMAPTWDEAMDAYARYDTIETPEGIRSRALEDAVRADGRDMLVSGADYDPELRAMTLPVELLAAPYGMFGQPGGLLPADRLSAYDDVAHVAVETVPDVNHYTILFAPHATERVAQAMVGEES
jgi:pimeloyl-ACP methyl ester carboxylesterase